MSLSNQRKVGIIIKNDYLIAVEVSHGKGTPIVSNYAKVNLEEGIIDNNCHVLNEEVFKNAVLELLANGIGGKINAKNILINIPDDKTFTHELVIKKEYLSDVDHIKEVASDYIPIELEEAVFDYKVISENAEDKTVKLNFVAAQNTIAKPLIAIFKEIELNVVGIDIDTNSILRSFDNDLIKEKNDFLLLNLSMDRDLIVIKSKEGSVYRMAYPKNGKETTKKLKAILNLDTNDQVFAILNKEKSEEAIGPGDRTAIAESEKEYIEHLCEKVAQLENVAKSKQDIVIKTIYLTGVLSQLPGIKKTLQEKMPNVEIKSKVEFVSIPDEIEDEILEGLGLCLKGLSKDDKTDINLLTEGKKSELMMSRLVPKVRRYAVASILVLGLLLTWTGISAFTSFLDYKITSQEVVVLNEQTLNPYITDLARDTQQTKQLQDQILSIVNSTLPVSTVIRSIDSYNLNGISLLNFDMTHSKASQQPIIKLRAKATNRNETEKFVEEVEQLTIFSEVVSPLSNLVGKGERFIHVDFMIDVDEAIKLFREKENNE